MAAGRQQRGQALVLLLGLLGALSAAFYFVIAAGEVAGDKLRLLNAADAAVLSAATWEARTLNLEATLNRAVVANEAAIAQSVSLRSWSSYMDRLLPNMNQILRYVPYLGAATVGLQRVWHGIDAVTQPGLRTAELAASTIDHEFAVTAELLNASAPATARAVALAAVAAADVPAQLSRGGQALLAQDAPAWAALTSRYSGEARARQADLILRSTDSFTQQRNHRFAIEPAGALVRIEKRGGTDLIGFDAWRGVDSQSLHARRFLVLGAWRERVPLGWGAAEAGRQDARAGRYGGSRAVNPTATRLALASLRRNPGYLGIPALRDVRAPQLRTNPEHRLALRLSARSVAGPLLYSDAAAVVRYRRPESRVDRAAERGSLFEPYWQARLSTLRAADRALADRRDGIAPARRGLDL